MDFLHRLKHLFGLNKGQVVTINIDGKEIYWIAFQCEDCGDISGLCKPLDSGWKEIKEKEKKEKNVSI